VNGWSLTYEGFLPTEEGLREALCTLGNGVFATRGAAPEAVADEVHYPGTYAAGVYDRLRTEIGGRGIENEDLVNLPNWLVLTFRPEGGNWLDLGSVEVLSYMQELDLRTGVLSRAFRFRDADGRTTGVRQRRLVSMAEPHLAALETTIVPEDWSGRLPEPARRSPRSAVEPDPRRRRDLAGGGDAGLPHPDRGGREDPPAPS